MELYSYLVCQMVVCSKYIEYVWWRNDSLYMIFYYHVIRLCYSDLDVNDIKL